MKLSMYYLLVVVFLPPISTLHAIVAARPSQQNAQQSAQAKQDAQTQDILAEFAKIVNNFGNIVANPHHRPLVAANLAQMVASWLNIFDTANKNQVTVSELEDLLEEQMPLLRAMINSRAHSAS